MKQVIRTVGWATNVLWIVVLVFTITAVHSALQFDVRFAEETKTSVSDETMTLSLPFYIGNGGLYDISNFNLTTRVEGGQGISVSVSSTFVPLIPRGKNVTLTHNISLSLSDMLSKGFSNMLFNDSTLNVDLILKIEYARVIPLQISSNFSMPWGAPFYNLTLGKPIVDDASVTIPVNFENHSLFALNGTITLKLFDDSNRQVGASTTALNVQPLGSYSIPIHVPISGNPERIREAHLHFDTSIFSYGPVVFSID